ncbi:hypothetical protein [Indioceanicola profundi]|uniref:hypothetical protein n=1 Tax=Indioceanicola profundi TaxID=2220096 RepID=UPI000E6AD14A|nr:hypothetical protein [Indioceanicola profundi]
MGVVLPRAIEELARRRAEEAGFTDTADYIAHLVATDAAAGVDLESLLADGLQGPDLPLDIEALRAEGRARLGRN